MQNDQKMKVDNDNAAKNKSYAFALRIVKLNRYLCGECKEYVLSKQVLRAGTSIGANVVEGNRAQSKPDFIHKLSIALKEADETEYWLCLLRDSGYISQDQAASLLEDCSQIQRILTSSIKTAKSNIARATN